MHIYLAGRYGRREEILADSKRLEAAGHIITSEWIYGEHEAADETPTPKEARTWAHDDINDIEQADAFVLYMENDEAYQRMGRGGRWFELGYAMALCTHQSLIDRTTTIYAIGDPEQNIFSRLPEIIYCNHVDDLIGRLQLDETVADHKVPT